MRKVFKELKTENNMKKNYGGWVYTFPFIATTLSLIIKSYFDSYNWMWNEISTLISLMFCSTITIMMMAILLRRKYDAEKMGKK